MTRLTPAQRAFLIAADQADRGFVEPPSVKTTIAALVKRQLIVHVPQADGGPRVLITERGRAAVGGDFGSTTQSGTTAPDPVSYSSANETAPSKPVPPTTPSGKIGELAALLRRAGGASLDDMMVATGWRAHSVRGAMSGALKKKRGMAISSEKVNGIRHYRVADAVAA